MLRKYSNDPEKTEPGKTLKRVSTINFWTGFVFAIVTFFKITLFDDPSSWLDISIYIIISASWMVLAVAIKTCSQLVKIINSIFLAGLSGLLFIGTIYTFLWTLNNIVAIAPLIFMLSLTGISTTILIQLVKLDFYKLRIEEEQCIPCDQYELHPTDKKQ